MSSFSSLSHSLSLVAAPPRVVHIPRRPTRLCSLKCVSSQNKDSDGGRFSLPTFNSAVTRRAGLGLGAAAYGLQLLPGNGFQQPNILSGITQSAVADVEEDVGTSGAILHSVIRVPDIEAAAAYYQAVGMSVLRERPGNVFVGYGPEKPVGDRMVIELAQAKPGAEVGSVLDHFLVCVDDPRAAREAALAAGGTACKVYAGRTQAVEGPDGVKLVFTNGGEGIADPLCRIVLNVNHLEPTRLFMQGLGMKFFESRSDSLTGKRSIIMGYGRGPRTGATVEIVGPPRGVAGDFAMGDVLDRIALSSSNIDASVVKVKKSIDLAKGSNVAFGSVRKEPFVIARLGTKIAEVVDPTGVVYALVDEADFLRELA
mmetsp:Transcript_3937/g.7689  ORF Transcript_3937/g.7689 Transcript_3937/m.7689 type:complete len:370 (+) Transcript_3937:68-1177(+)